MNTKSTRPLRSLIAAAAGLAVIAGTVLGGSAAMANPADAIIGGTVVGGTGGQSNSIPAGALASTTCNGSNDSVTTSVQASPRQYTGGQWFNVRVWARDITGAVGAWTKQVDQQLWVKESYNGAITMPQRYQLATSTFRGVLLHYYQVSVEVLVYDNGRWVNLSKPVVHYTNPGAVETNVYGQLIQQMKGAGTSYCLVL